MRVPIIAGNWKMNKNIEESLQLVEDIKEFDLDKSVEAILCVPFTNIYAINKAIQGTNIKLGAQNMHWEDNGAYTGEISPLMLKELGVSYVILGHSERRGYFKETDEQINKKIKSALNHGLKPILCVGETLEEREGNLHKEIVKSQLLKGLEDITKDHIENIIIAYEPIWAIGTGKTASSDDAEDMLCFIREIIGSKYGEKETVRIQYGGSVNPNNIKELMKKPNIDGALVGGASLKAADFIKLVNYKLGE